MQVLVLVLPPCLFVFLHFAPAFAQPHDPTSSTSPELGKHPRAITISPRTLEPRAYSLSSNETNIPTATLPPIPSASSSAAQGHSTVKYNEYYVLVAEQEPNLKPARSTTLPPGKTPSGLSDTGPQIHNFVQGQKSDTGNPIASFPQPSAYINNPNSLAQSSSTTLQKASTSTSTSSVDSLIQLHHKAEAQSSNTILQQASTTSSPVVPVIQFIGIPIAQSTSRINHHSSSSLDNYNTLLTLFPHLASKIRPHATASNIYQTSSSSSFNGDPSPTTLSDSLLPDHPPAHFSAPTSVDIIPGPLATQIKVAEATASSAVELVHALIGGIALPQPGASTTPGKSINSALQSEGGGGGSSDGSGSFTLSGNSATGTGSATRSDGATGSGSATKSGSATRTDRATGTGSATGSDSVTGTSSTTRTDSAMGGSATRTDRATGTGSATRSGDTTQSGTATTTTGTGSATQSGSTTPSTISTETDTTTATSPTTPPPPSTPPQASQSTQTTIPTVSTGGGAKDLMHANSNRWLDVTILLCGVGVMYF